ncbi:hypothetical protein [Enterovirga rhinocerotis]|uniref:Uncharacterized protein n=1 Tax=Enterovirga rhinocerotis TaxID=1339210 RepID=A0A4R7C8P3_9HYPH|nr:hypothetical protein [Enterovirga rhinocerotis]TDR94808.1 hypothetical protein EV668_2097 [Enterovirga rhinocerotis]
MRFLSSILALVVLALASPAAARDPAGADALCPESTTKLRRDPALAAAVKAALPRAVVLPGGRGEASCHWPAKLLAFQGAEVLIMAKGRVGGMGHSEPAELSAFVLRRENGASRLVTVARDFTALGTMGNPGAIAAGRFGGDDAMTIESGGVFQGYSYSDLHLYLFRAGRIVAMKPIRLSASNAGAKEDEKEIVDVEGIFELDRPEPRSMTLRFAVTDKGSKRREIVVLKAQDTDWTVESGRLPPEMDEASGN